MEPEWFRVLANCLGKNSLSYPVCHGVLVGVFFLINLLALATGSGGLFFALGVESDEYKTADSVDQLVGCRWESLGAGPSAALSVVAILVSIVPAIASVLLVKNSPEGCRSAFKVERFALYEARVPTSEENMAAVRRVSLLVKRSYVYTGLPLALLSVSSTCAVPSTIVSVIGWVGAFLLGAYWRGGFSLKLPDTTSRLNDVLAPPGGVFYYVGMMWGGVGLAIDDSDSPTAVSTIFIFLLGLLTLDLSLSGGNGRGSRVAATAGLLLSITTPTAKVQRTTSLVIQLLDAESRGVAYSILRDIKKLDLPLVSGGFCWAGDWAPLAKKMGCPGRLPLSRSRMDSAGHKVSTFHLEARRISQ